MLEPAAREEPLSVFFPASEELRDLPLQLEAVVESGELILRDCGVLAVDDDRFANPPLPFCEDYRYRKGARKRLIFFGASQLADNCGPNPFPYLLDLHLEREFPGRFDVVNLATWSATFPDHIFDWHRIQACGEDRPLFRHQAIETHGPAAVRPALGEGIGARDLEPDLVVVASTVNDFVDEVFVEDLGVPAEGGVPLTFSYLDCLRRHAEGDDLAAACVTAFQERIQAFRAAGGQGGPEREILARREGITRQYRLMMRQFIERVRASHPGIPIVLLTVPMRRHPEPGSVDRTSMHDFFVYPEGFWREAEDIQNAVSASVAGEYPGVRLVDLSREYHRHEARFSRREWARLEYIIDDGVHFSPRGNALLADWLLLRTRDFLKEML
jgi:lysophospholipase L1-like esterase